MEEFKRKTLIGNAERLAKIPDNMGVGKNLTAFISFTVAGEKVLLSAEHVIEVIKFKDVTPLPGVDEKLAGIYNFRGYVIGVFCSNKVFELKRDVVVPKKYLLICNYENINFAIACEDVAGIEHRDVESLLQGENKQLLPAFFSGVFEDSARCVDIEKLITNDILKIL